MNQARHASIVAVVLVLAGTASGITLHVPTDYSTIQAAIDGAAASGDEIEVAPGTYTENINFSGKALRLYSSSGDPTNTTIQGTGSGPAVSCTSGETSATVLEGFTITGGSAYDGGGMYNSGSSPTVITCTFSGNSAYHDGGGMFNYYCSPTVTDCTFSDNWATIGSGSGMYNFTSSPTVTGCTFSGNVAPWAGAGMYNWYCNGPTVANCNFSSNSASEGGGGICNDRTNALVANCAFSGNSASNYGGGMYNVYCSPTVTNCTFSNNSAGSGGGMHNYFSGNPTVTNCIVWSNSGGEIYGPATVANSDVQGGHAGVGNIDADPFFVGLGDLHLSAGSPCIDAGNDAAVPAGMTSDLDGNPRIQGTAVDMGAYESAHVPANNAPVIEAISGPLEPVQVNTVVTTGASFADPDVGDSHTAQWDWGDDTTPTAGVVDESAKTVSGSHTYSRAGVHTVTLTVTDAAGESDSDVFEYVVVYDPAAGFVTGGGWIDSPPGAYTPDPGLTGKANFGFVSKYQKGATAPTGNTEFQFKAGDLNFHSSSYEWLVVTGSNYAKFKGTGTINGAGEYKFMLWAGDDDPDTFRIRIWTEPDGTEDVIYDNGFDQGIGGGSIVIHTK